MDRQQFIYRLSIAVVGGFVLAALLRLGFGERWFSFYGWAVVALTMVPFVAVLLWKRLPKAGRSRWWSVLVAAPVLAAGLLQIAFWHLFFSQGVTDPTLGVAREMLRPFLDAVRPFLLALLAIAAVWLIVISARAGTDEL